jgi:hypothetical protein
MLLISKTFLYYNIIIAGVSSLENILRKVIEQHNYVNKNSLPKKAESIVFDIIT